MRRPVQSALFAMAALLALALPAPASAAGVNHLPAASRSATVAGPSFRGIDDSTSSFADPTSAVGPSSLVEIVDFKVAIYDRSGALITSAPLWTLFGGNQFSLSDPQSQVMWDPATNRFYYDLLFGDTIEIGFSKSSNPTSIPNDFCNYAVDYGYATGPDFPDFLRLGDTRDSLLIGVNRLQNFGDVNLQTGSDVDWMTKPAGTGTITTCPAQSTFQTGRVAGLTMSDGSMINAPVPAQQTDPSTTGWIVTIPTLTNTQLPLFQVTENADGTPNIATNPTSAPTVAKFSAPPGVAEPNFGFLDPLDGRLLNAVTAIDPARNNAMALWTAHAVGNGRSGRLARAQARWYEIDVNGAAVLQHGVATSNTTNVFNPSIAPDRAVSGTSAAFGSDMVMSFNTSSSSAGPDIQMVSKVGNNAQSSFVPVKTSAGPDQGIECFVTCLWGKYGGASPDPAASPAGSEGNVWLTSMWSQGGGVNTGASEWSTWNWEATP
jgi:hypothetical protein